MMSLNVALDRYYSHMGRGKHLFARECQSGAREYVLMTPEEAWEETESRTPSHLYEVLAGPCKLYLDIEWKQDAPPEQDAELCKVQSIVQKTLACVKRVFGVDATHTLVTASGYVPGGQYKCSWHVHFDTPGVAWNSATDVGAFVKQHLSDVHAVDTVPYKAPKQNWRCVGSSKHSEPSRYLRPVNKKRFLDCLVSLGAGGTGVVQVPRAPDGSIYATFKTLVDMFPNARKDAVTWADNGCCRYLAIPFLRQPCPIAGRTHRSNHQYAIVDTVGMRWRHKCHNAGCSKTVAPWQPMPNFDVAKAFLNAPTTKANAAVLAPEGTMSDRQCIRSRGPPPVHLFTHKCRFIKCSNGTYMLHQ
tara:strand:- start:177 stop:1253 length:1077 start_codon:yes stop_codon:yes gene_type:complete